MLGGRGLQGLWALGDCGLGDRELGDRGLWLLESLSGDDVLEVDQAPLVLTTGCLSEELRGDERVLWRAIRTAGSATASPLLP